MSDSSHVTFLADSLKYDNHFSLSADKNKGGLAAMGNSDQFTSIVQKNQNLIIAKVYKKKWLLVMIYGKPNKLDRDIV